MFLQLGSDSKQKTELKLEYSNTTPIPLCLAGGVKYRSNDVYLEQTSLLCLMVHSH